MGSKRFLFCGLLVSITLHAHASTLQDAQATPGNNEIEHCILKSFGYTIKDKQEGPDPAMIRANAVDKLLDSMEDATAKWRNLEATYAKFLADDSAFTGLMAFLDAETGEGISASDILLEEVEALQNIYRGCIIAIDVSRDREEFFAKDISLLKHWRRLTQIKEFQIPECTDLNNAALLNAYNMEMVFSDLEVINRGYGFVFETFISTIYQEWLTCLLSEIAELNQDPNFSGFECEAGVAAQMKQISVHVSLVLGKLEAVGAEFDNTLATFKTAVEGSGDDCYDTGRMLDAVNALISLSGTRRENEVGIVALNQSYFGAFQRWLNFFTATERGVDNNKAELVGLLEKLFDYDSGKKQG